MTSINENNITFRQIKSYLENQCIDINSIEAQYSKLTANTVTNTEKDKIMAYFTANKSKVIDFCNAHNRLEEQQSSLKKIV